MAPVEGRDLLHAESFRRRDDRGVHRAEGQVALGADQLGDPQPVLQAVLARLKAGTPEQPRCLVGDRGYGKTAVLVELAEMAREAGVWAITLEAAADAELVARLVAAIRDLLRAHDPDRRAGQRARRLLRMLASLKVSAGLVSVTLDAPPLPGHADSGDLGADLGDVLVEFGNLTAAAGSGVLLMIDEIQAAPETQLRPLLRGLQQSNRTMVDRLRRVPVALVTAGLPHALSWLREHGGTYGERTRELELGALSDGAVIDALRSPSEERDVEWADDALAVCVEAAGGYPYAVQLLGYEAWRDAEGGQRVTETHAHVAAEAAGRALGSLYRSRFESLPTRERSYLVALASLPESQRTSGAIAAAMGTTSNRVGSARARLIAAGVIRADPGGRVSLTVPGMDAWLRSLDERGT